MKAALCVGALTFLLLAACTPAANNDAEIVDSRMHQTPRSPEGLARLNQAELSALVRGTTMTLSSPDADGPTNWYLGCAGEWEQRGGQGARDQGVYTIEGGALCIDRHAGRSCHALYAGDDGNFIGAATPSPDARPDLVDRVEFQSNDPACS